MTDAEICETLSKEREIERKKGKREAQSSKKFVPGQCIVRIKKLVRRYFSDIPSDILSLSTLPASRPCSAYLTAFCRKMRTR